jgi:hypothetical protein
MSLWPVLILFPLHHLSLFRRLLFFALVLIFLAALVAHWMILSYSSGKAAALFHARLRAGSSRSFARELAGYAAKDRVAAAHDYEVNLKAELEILALH